MLAFQLSSFGLKKVKKIFAIRQQCMIYLSAADGQQFSYNSCYEIYKSKFMTKIFLKLFLGVLLYRC